MYAWNLRFTLTLSVFVIANVVSLEIRAGTCEDRCTQSFQSCASMKAAGCEVRGTLVGKAASALGDQIPIPGMGALFGAMAKGTSKGQCEKLLAPCEEIRQNCLEECKRQTPSSGTGAVSAITAPTKFGTLRVFSDHATTRIYLNENRMGATPENTEEPFIATEVPVGKYWVRLITPDERWVWEGEKVVEEGNVNAVEGKLVDLKGEAWKKAVALDEADAAGRAVVAYTKFIKKYPNDAENVTFAEGRIIELKTKAEEAEWELFERIDEEKDTEKKIALCQVYLFELPKAGRRPAVEQILAEAQKPKEEPQSELDKLAAAASAAQAEKDAKEKQFEDDWNKTKTIASDNSLEKDQRIAALEAFLKEHPEGNQYSKMIADWKEALLSGERFDADSYIDPDYLMTKFEWGSVRVGGGYIFGEMFDFQLSLSLVTLRWKHFYWEILRGRWLMHGEALVGGTCIGIPWHIKRNGRHEIRTGVAVLGGRMSVSLGQDENNDYHKKTSDGPHIAPEITYIYYIRKHFAINTGIGMIFSTTVPDGDHNSVYEKLPPIVNIHIGITI